jgi:hypothetical protein
VILRMDDIQYGWHSDVQASVVEWALTKNVKLNLGIISGPDPNGVCWPTTCAASPSAPHCDDPVVSSVYKAYAAGQVLGRTGQPGWNGTLELFNHAWDHQGWVSLSDADQAADIAKSVGALRSAFPAAGIETFVPPQNIADASTLAAVAGNDMSILSSMGTLACPATPPNPGVAPRWNYQYAPCMGQSTAWSDPAEWYCIPSNDTYADIDGFKKMPDGKVYSVPTGSANTPMNFVTTGLGPEDALGAGDCGCHGSTCAVVPSAVNNAAKSNGLHWTVMMMHPQTAFPDQSYVEWLDAFVAAAAALDDFDVHFVHFQELVAMKAPLAPTPAPTRPCAKDYAQCTGAGWTSLCCSANFACVGDGSGYYAQCLPPK